MSKIYCVYSPASIIVYAVIFLLALVTIVPTVYLSFHVVNYNEVAFVRDIFGAVDTSYLLYPGRHFLLLTKTTVNFDSTYQTVKFQQSDNNAVRVFLSNGVEIDIDITFQYRIDVNKLSLLYNQYSTSYSSKAISVAQSIIKDTVTKYEINDYVTNRNSIVSDIAYNLQTALYESNGLYLMVPIENVQLLNIHLPDIILNKNLQISIEIQNNQVALLQQQIIEIQSETQKQVAAINATRNSIISEAIIKGNQIIDFANIYAKRIEVEARTIGLDYFFSTLNITQNDDAFKNEIIYTLNLLDATGKLKLIQTRQNQTSPSVLVNTN